MPRLMQGDCLELMREIEAGSVDMVLADPPYGATKCKWDSVIPLEPMWEHLKRVIKQNGAIVMTASQPFTTTLISSNMEMFKYCWVWEKSRSSGFQHAKNKPLKSHEDVVVFSRGAVNHAVLSGKNRMQYNPQGVDNNPFFHHAFKRSRDQHGYFGEAETTGYVASGSGYPKSVLRVASEHNPPHATQKPVALMEYMVKTYTNEGETVLDFAMGSGTTGVACRNLGREFIGIELDSDYFEIAKGRIGAV